jgi:glycosyltransferase involved in cell wall biosynthesis
LHTDQVYLSHVHVLQITPYFPPTWAYGGIPRIVDGLSRALVDEGVRVSVLTTDVLDETHRSGVEPIRDHHGVTVYTVGNASNRLAYRHQLFLPRGIAGTLASIPDVDLIHLHGHRHLLNNAAVRWAGQRGLPYVLTANGTLLRHERKVGVKWLWDALVAGHIPGGAARCIAVSRADAAMHHQAGIPTERVRLIPNGLDLGEFDPLPQRGRFRQQWDLPQGPLVVYLGQISPRKGVEHLVAAFADGGLGGATLVIAGNDMGGLATAQAALKPGSPVRFVGLLEGRERLELLADADVLVYASTAEVFGLVPFEGLLCGAPVVVGDDCGCGELIAESGAGLLVRHGDVAGLKARIRTLLLDRVAAEAMVSRGRHYIRERLGFAPIARQHQALYAEVVAA